MKTYIKWIVYVIIITFLFILQTSFFPQFIIFRIKPDLILLFVLAVSLLKGYKEGMTLGILSGVLTGLLSWNCMGIYILTYGMTGFFVGLIPERVEPDNFLIPLMSGILATVGFSFVFWFMGTSFELFLSLPHDFYIFLRFLIWNTVLTLPVFYFTRYLLFSTDEDIRIQKEKFKSNYLLK